MMKLSFRLLARIAFLLLVLVLLAIGGVLAWFTSWRSDRLAAMFGVETPVDRRVVRKTLKSIHRYNFKKDLSSHANCQRPGYAMGRESGLVLCSWPRDGRPTLPFVYSDEVWTGVEYQVASHLIMEGFVREGLQLVRGVRSRYTGRTRNPFNEYECGSYYARAMASYALLGALSGFRYSAVEKTLWFGPKTGLRPFQVFFAVASAWGIIKRGKNKLTIQVVEGTLPLARIVLSGSGTQTEVSAAVTVTASAPFSIPVKP